MPLPYRPNVCMLVYNRNNEILICERARTPDSWQFPQGGVEPDDSLEESVLRELEEELGASRELFAISYQLNTTYKYDWDQIPEFAKGIWRGQSQSFWLVSYLGTDKQIILDRSCGEFRNWKWCARDKLLKLTDKIRFESYKLVLEEIEKRALLP